MDPARRVKTADTLMTRLARYVGATATVKRDDEVVAAPAALKSPVASTRTRSKTQSVAAIDKEETVAEMFTTAIDGGVVPAGEGHETVNEFGPTVSGLSEDQTEEGTASTRLARPPESQLGDPLDTAAAGSPSMHKGTAEGPRLDLGLDLGSAESPGRSDRKANASEAPTQTTAAEQGAATSTGTQALARRERPKREAAQGKCYIESVLANRVIKVASPPKRRRVQYAVGFPDPLGSPRAHRGSRNAAASDAARVSPAHARLPRSASPEWEPSKRSGGGGAVRPSQARAEAALASQWPEQDGEGPADDEMVPWEVKEQRPDSCSSDLEAREGQHAEAPKQVVPEQRGADGPASQRGHSSEEQRTGEPKPIEQEAGPAEEPPQAARAPPIAPWLPCAGPPMAARPANAKSFARRRRLQAAQATAVSAPDRLQPDATENTAQAQPDSQPAADAARATTAAPHTAQARPDPRPMADAAPAATAAPQAPADARRTRTPEQEPRAQPQPQPPADTRMTPEPEPQAQPQPQPPADTRRTPEPEPRAHAQPRAATQSPAERAQLQQAAAPQTPADEPVDAEEAAAPDRSPQPPDDQPTASELAAQAQAHERNWVQLQQIIAAEEAKLDGDDAAATAQARRLSRTMVLGVRYGGLDPVWMEVPQDATVRFLKREVRRQLNGVTPKLETDMLELRLLDVARPGNADPKQRTTVLVELAAGGSELRLEQYGLGNRGEVRLFFVSPCAARRDRLAAAQVLVDAMGPAGNDDYDGAGRTRGGSRSTRAAGQPADRPAPAGPAGLSPQARAAAERYTAQVAEGAAAARAERAEQQARRTTEAASSPPKRQHYSNEEIEALIRGVETHGTGNWSKILSQSGDVFLSSRTGVSLKDCWKNLTNNVKHGSMGTRSRMSREQYLRVQQLLPEYQ